MLGSRGLAFAQNVFFRGNEAEGSGIERHSDDIPDILAHLRGLQRPHWSAIHLRNRFLNHRQRHE